MTFEEFQATGRDVENLQDVADVAAQLGHERPVPGRVYLTGGLFIERESSIWRLQMEGQHRSPDLEALERVLYRFYCREYGA